MRSDEDLAQDIAAAARDAATIVARGHRTFTSDPVLVRAAKNIVTEIGEAAKRLSDEAIDAMPGPPWKAIKGMRDKVVHDYPDVDVDVLWATLGEALPQLLAIVEGFLARPR